MEKKTQSRADKINICFELRSRPRTSFLKRKHLSSILREKRRAVVTADPDVQREADVLGYNNFWTNERELYKGEQPEAALTTSNKINFKGGTRIKGLSSALKMGERVAFLGMKTRPFEHIPRLRKGSPGKMQTHTENGQP